MAKVIDERVTEMRFDNKHFETNITTSIDSVNRLKDSLNFSKSTQSMKHMESASTSMANNLGGAINGVISRFSALEVMGITALANITNSAVNAGKRIVSSLTIDPIKTGFQEYETQINAVQTILANTESKGSTLKDVNKALDELNKYADMTIYNFTEMTRNIGTFTAAGVDLETSVSAIKGIANLAAVSGSNAQQASTAMYQLSQALAAGTVKLQDWNSVVNAGMGGQVFQDALKETARVHGVKIDQMIKKEGSFRETLQKGWLTSTILTETLAKFTGDLNEKQLKSMGYTDKQIKGIIKMGKTANDAATKVKTFTQLFDTLKEAAQSGWTQTWEILVGDFEEAKELLTSISDTVSGFINSMSDSRNKLLSGWKDLGGRTKMIQGITNIFKYLLDILKPIGEAFRDIFPPTTSEQLMSLTDGFLSFTERLVVSEEQAKRIKSTFSGLFAILKGISNAIKTVSKVISPLTIVVGKSIDMFLSITAILGDFVVAMGDAINKSKLFSSIFTSVNHVIESVVGIVTGGIDKIKEVFNSINFFSGESLQNASEEAQNALEPFKTIGTAFMNTFKGITKLIKKAADYLVKGFEFVGNKINEVLSGEGMKNLFDFTNGALITTILFGVKKLIDKISEFSVSDIGFLDSINETLGAVKETLKAYQSQLKAGTLMQISTAILILTGALFTLALIEPDRLTGSLGAMAGLMTEMLAMMFVVDKMASKGGFKGIVRVSSAMISISLAVNIMASALKKLSKIPFTSTIKGLASLTTIMLNMSINARIMSKAQGGLIRISFAMMILGGALNIMAGAVNKFGKIDIVSLGKGLLGVVSMLGIMSMFSRSITNTKGLISLSIAMIILGDSMLIFADAIQKFGEIKMETLGKGLLSLVSVLGVVSMAMKSIPKGMVMQSVSLVIIASSLKIFSQAIESIGDIEWESLGKGLLGMVSALGIVSMAMKSIPKGTVTKGAGLVVIATSLKMFSQAIQSMGSMDLETIAKGLLTMVSALGVISMAMRSLTGALPGAASLLVVATAIRILAPALEKFGKLSLAEVGKSLLLLASAFTIIGVAGLLLTPILPSLMLLGAAITLIGIGCAAAGAGLLAFSAGLTALVGVGSAGITILFELFKKVMDLIPIFFEKVAQGIESLILNLAKSSESIVSGLVQIGGAIINGLVVLIPQLVNAVLLIISSIITALMEHVPDMVDAGMKLVAGFLKGIASNISDVVQSGADIVINFLNGLSTKIPEIVDAALNLTVKFIDGLATGIDKHGPKLVAAVIRLFKSVIKTILSVITGSFSSIYKKGEEIADWISGGIKSGASKVIESIGGIIKGCIDKIKDSWSDFKEAGSNLVSGIKEGINSKWNDLKTSVGELGASISNKFKSVMGIHSPSRVFAGFGKFLDMGLIQGIKAYSGKVSRATDSMGEDAIEAMREALKDLDLDIDDTDFPNKPIITPVIDSSLVDKGFSYLNSLFKDNPNLNVGYSAVGGHIKDNIQSISNTKTNIKSDSEIVDAIKDLKSSIKNIGGDNYNLNGITYDDGSNVSDAISTLVRAAKIERRKD